jgi:hypothetical protein
VEDERRSNDVGDSQLNCEFRRSSCEFTVVHLTTSHEARPAWHVTCIATLVAVYGLALPPKLPALSLVRLIVSRVSLVETL